MQRPHPLLFDLQRLVTDLALIDRNHYQAGTDNRRENDIEHSFSVALLCWFIVERYNVELNLEKILKYALCHDFVERYAGDTNTFASTKDRKNKVDKERVSLSKLSKEFHNFPDMVKSMKSYEEKTDAESLFVWTVDKMQALILGDLDGWRSYEEFGILYNWFLEKYKEQLKRSSPYAKEIFEGLIEYCKSTYFDQPNS